MSPAEVESRIRNDEITDTEAQTAEDSAVRVNYWPIPTLPAHPEWTETYSVESRSTFEFLGFVGRLGLSGSYGYDDGLPGDRGKGRKRSLHEAIMALVNLTEVDS